MPWEPPPKYLSNMYAGFSLEAGNRRTPAATFGISAAYFCWLLPFELSKFTFSFWRLLTLHWSYKNKGARKWKFLTLILGLMFLLWMILSKVFSMYINADSQSAMLITEARRTGGKYAPITRCFSSGFPQKNNGWEKARRGRWKSKYIGIFFEESTAAFRCRRVSIKCIWVSVYIDLKDCESTQILRTE